MSVSPCFMPCGARACQTLGCVRVYNASGERDDRSEAQRPQELVREFHEAFGIVAADDPTPPTRELHYLRTGLIREESLELDAALEDASTGHAPLHEVAKELADLAYVTYGTAVSLGIDLDAAIREVHRSNMSKLGADGQPVLREDGKVLKGPNYAPADPERLVAGWSP